MPSSDPIQRFQNILENIARIEQYTDGIDLPAFMSDHKTYDAVESHGQKYVPSETSSVTNMTGWKEIAFGSWLKMICRR